MLEIKSLERALEMLKQGEEIEIETLKNISENSRIEAMNFTPEDIEHRQEYIKLVCRVYGLATLELGRRKGM